jgi:hypothetical protein
MFFPQAAATQAVVLKPPKACRQLEGAGNRRRINDYGHGQEWVAVPSCTVDLALLSRVGIVRGFLEDRRTRIRQARLLGHLASRLTPLSCGPAAMVERQL